MTGYSRTTEELLECTSYGRLYRVQKICGGKFLCMRYRRRKNTLVPDVNERITLSDHKSTIRPPRVGDFAFVSTDGVWSHFAVDRRKDETTD
jgi:hypothetical protein